MANWRVKDQLLLGTIRREKGNGVVRKECEVWGWGGGSFQSISKKEGSLAELEGGGGRERQ